jgi:hypothetical protein
LQEDIAKPVVFGVVVVEVGEPIPEVGQRRRLFTPPIEQQRKNEDLPVEIVSPQCPRHCDDRGCKKRTCTIEEIPRDRRLQMTRVGLESVTEVTSVVRITRGSPQATAWRGSTMKAWNTGKES